VVARLLHGDLTVGVLGHEHDAVGRDRPLADELHEAVVILLRELGDEIDGDQNVQLVVAGHDAPL